MTESSVVPEGAEAQIKTTELDLDQVAPQLAAWIGDQLGSDSTPEVRSLRRPEHSGMSSISVLIDLAWTKAGEEHSAELVARLAPEDSAFPVFPTYDFQRQYDVMRQVGARSSLPVPRVRWVEPSGQVLGVPFLVMDRVSGVAPVDNPPYVFDGWLLRLDRADQGEGQRASVDVLAQIHQIPDPTSVVAPLPGDPGVSHLRRHLEQERAYYDWTRRADGLRIPVLERAFDWLEQNWPADPSPDVVCWGDARIGNILYEGTSPVAVLDWESAALAPPELDLGWFLFFHRMFQDIAEVFEMPGLPHLFRRADVVAQYEEATGAPVRDLDFYLVYAALRHGIVMSQIERRRIHFGEVEPHDDLDAYVLHHQMLSDLIDGTYSWEK